MSSLSGKSIVVSSGNSGAGQATVPVTLRIDLIAA